MLQDIVLSAPQLASADPLGFHDTHQTWSWWAMGKIKNLINCTRIWDPQTPMLMTSAHFKWPFGAFEVYTPTKLVLVHTLHHLLGLLLFCVLSYHPLAPMPLHDFVFIGLQIH